MRGESFRLSKKGKRKYKKTDKEYAAQFDVTDRAVRGWKAKNYPLDDPTAMRRIFDEQRNQSEASKPSEIGKAKLSKVQLECMRIELDLSLRRGELIARSVVREDGIRLGATLEAGFSALLNDMPGVLAGLSELQVRQKLSARLLSLQNSIKRELANVATN